MVHLKSRTSRNINDDVGCRMIFVEILKFPSLFLTGMLARRIHGDLNESLKEGSLRLSEATLDKNWQSYSGSLKTKVNVLTT